MDKRPSTSTCPYPHLVIRNRSTGKTNLASCAVAAIFLVFIILAAAIVIFLLFRPRDPSVHVTAVRLPGFTASNSTASFTFDLSASVRNPNRDSFSHYGSTIRLLYGNNQVGFMYIPAGEIAGDLTQNMEASFAVGKFDRNGDGNVVEVETRIGLKGSVRVLKVFMHRVQVVEVCSVAVAAVSGAVMWVRC